MLACRFLVAGAALCAGAVDNFLGRHNMLLYGQGAVLMNRSVRAALT